MTIPIYDAAVLALSVGRISYSITSDEIFRPVREFVYRYSAPISATDIDGNPHRMIHHWKNNKREREAGWGKWSSDFDPELGVRDPGFFGELISCVYCASFYASFAALAAYIVWPEQTIVALTGFALWSACSIIGGRLL